MFETVEDAVRAFRAAAVENRAAHGQRDYPEMQASNDRIRAASAALRAHARADLIQPLTMEWIALGRNQADYEYWQGEVQKLLS